ncbi:hypothetical protein N7G274_009997 [Stereocaulon virgatum]|uniref:Uncharacterized protein n=1 Tax=Stereocaulon virgatum TaxID=373712 RepID=A0ABR3ZX30_9LECA
MEAQRWHEVESIELTQWVKIFCKRTENLPTSATRSVPGKSLKQVLNDTNSLRHAAVHRLPTTAAEIVSMLRAAHLFTTILNDPLRTSEIERIRIKASLAISYYSADGPRRNSGLSSYGDQTDHPERQMSAQNHEESAAGFSNAKYGILHKDRLNLFPMAEDEDENELDVKPHPHTTDTYHSPNASGPGVEEDSEASDWLSFLSGTPISEEADKETVAHIAKVSNAGDTSAGHVAVPATALASQPAMSAQTSSIPYSISSADVKAPQVKTHISMPDQGILMDTDMLAPIMSVVSSTGTAILNHARAAYEWCVAEDAEYQ